MSEGNRENPDIKWIKDSLIDNFLGYSLVIIAAVIVASIMIYPHFASTIGYDISVDLNPKDITAAPGDQIQAGVLVKKNKTYDQPVSLTANNLPKNVEISFLPQSGIMPTYSSIMEIIVSPNATEVDKRQIEIKGMGANEKGNGKSDHFNLTIRRINNTSVASAI